MIANATTYDEIVRAVASKLSWDYDNLTDTEWELIRTEISNALDWAWRAWWFEDLMVTERVQLKADWSAAATYALGDWVLHPDSDDYYVAVQASTNQPPATFDGQDWTTNYSYWVRLNEPEDVDAGSWMDATLYALGDQVVWNGDLYACIQAHTSSSSLIPSDASYWSTVDAFDFTVPYDWPGRPVIGRVRWVCAQDPRAYPECEKFEFQPVAEGIRIPTLDVSRPWLVYRVRCPELTGADYDDTASYSTEPAAKAVWGL